MQHGYVATMQHQFKKVLILGLYKYKDKLKALNNGLLLIFRKVLSKRLFFLGKIIQ